MKVGIITGWGRSVILFRRELVEAFIRRGHEVVVLAGDFSDSCNVLEELGVRCVPIRLDRTGMNPVEDFLVFFDLFVKLKREKLDCVFSYTVKSLIYGSIAARLAGIKKVFSMVTGLGFLFLDETVQQRLLRILIAPLYYVAVRCNTVLFLQNEDDLKELRAHGLIPTTVKTIVTGGSGVSLKVYPFVLPVLHPPVRFLMVARLYREKGVVEYIRACSEISNRNRFARFQLIAPSDNNPSRLRSEDVARECRRIGIEFVDWFVEDLRPYYNACHIFVLPSYREGMPRTALEAMATGRPLIVCDVPGSRDTIVGAQGEIVDGVRMGENGFLVRAKDVDALAAAMDMFLSEPGSIERMGIVSFETCALRFDVRGVNEVILSEIEGCD